MRYLTLSHIILINHEDQMYEDQFEKLSSNVTISLYNYYLIQKII